MTSKSGEDAEIQPESLSLTWRLRGPDALSQTLTQERDGSKELNSLRRLEPV